MLNRGGPLSKIVGGTIGLAKEYKADREQRKAAEASQTGVVSSQPAVQEQASHDYSSYQYSSHGGWNDDEDTTEVENCLLDLDEAQQALHDENESEESKKAAKQSFNLNRFLQSFVERHPTQPGYQQSLESLVLLPQRRPKSQHKGFVRAYAPELQKCQIDQETWLEFLDGFEASISRNAWFHVTNVGILVAGTASALTLGISPALHMASMALHVSIEAGRRGYMNHQQNEYLDVMNEQFFKPRNLFCMVVKYEPHSDEVVQTLDMDHNVVQSVEGRQEQSKWKGMFKNSAMTIQGQTGMLEPAMLIFPEPAAADGTASSNAFKNLGRVMGEYKDRRAAASASAEDVDGKMPVAPHQGFASVYGDPNSSANQGGFVSLLSKGTRSSLGPAGGPTAKLRERLEARQRQRKERKKSRPMTRMMKSHALYLMVTNLPSQEVMDRVAAQMQIQMRDA